MAIIAIETLTVGKAIYQIAGYDIGAASASDGLRLRFELMPEGRLIDVTLSKYELDLIREWADQKQAERAADLKGA